MRDELYGEILLDHYRYPRHFGVLPNPSVRVQGKNPLCGDEFLIDLNLEGDVVREIRFSGRGCAISMASASMMTELVTGKSVAEIQEWIDRFRNFLRDGGAPPEGVDMGDLQALAGVAHLPVRVKCAILAWTTLEEGINQCKNGLSPAALQGVARDSGV
jgi:nitrogen fixation NifU-like protein